jgi:hypothetical protein
LLLSRRLRRLCWASRFVRESVPHRPCAGDGEGGDSREGEGGEHEKGRESEQGGGASSWRIAMDERPGCAARGSAVISDGGQVDRAAPWMLAGPWMLVRAHAYAAGREPGVPGSASGRAQSR